MSDEQQRGGRGERKGLLRGARVSQRPSRTNQTPPPPSVLPKLPPCFLEPCLHPSLELTYHWQCLSTYLRGPAFLGQVWSG